MRRPSVLIALTTLAIGLLIGSQLRPAPSAADGSVTPGADIVYGFDSDGLAQLPLSPLEAAAKNIWIELHQGNGSSAPASVSLVRYTYDPGGYLALPYPYPAPVAYYVEGGTLTLEAIGPEVRIAEVDRNPDAGADTETLVLGPATLNVGGRYEVAAGNFVYAMDGNLGPTRNDGSTPLVVLTIFLQP